MLAVQISPEVATNSVAVLHERIVMPCSGSHQAPGTGLLVGLRGGRQTAVAHFAVSWQDKVAMCVLKCCLLLIICIIINLRVPIQDYVLEQCALQLI